MQLSWSNYLRSHPLRQDYEDHPSSIQDLFSHRESATNCFRHLTDNHTLVCLTRCQVDKDIQATFFHHLSKDSISQRRPFYYVLQGFGKRAQAVRMDPEKVFTQTSQTKQIPTYQELLACRTAEDVTALVEAVTLRRTPTKKLEFFTILQPSLSELLFQEDNLDVTHLLLKFVKHINPPIPSENETTDSDTSSGYRVSPSDDSSSTSEEHSSDNATNNQAEININENGREEENRNDQAS